MKTTKFAGLTSLLIAAILSGCSLEEVVDRGQKCPPSDAQEGSVLTSIKVGSATCKREYAEDEPVPHNCISADILQAFESNTCPYDQKYCVEDSNNTSNYYCEADCASGFVRCGGRCVDPLVANHYCGATLDGACSDESSDSPNYKGIDCGSSQYCNRGVCETSEICSDSQVACSGKCINPQTDQYHCGAAGECTSTDMYDSNFAGSECKSGESCQYGTCKSGCIGDLVLCNNQCIDPAVTASNCGAKGTCSSPDPENENFVGVQCKPNEICMDNTCVENCSNGQILCNKKCINPLENPEFCGARGTCSSTEDDENYAGETCSGNRICQEGSCKCPENAPIFCKLSDDLSLCVDPQVKNEYCGCTEDNAGTDCTQMMGEDGLNYSCVDSVCTLTNCNAGETQCGDTCINLFAADMNNCGKCGQVCSTNAPSNSSAASCDLGTCRYACDDGYYNTCLLTANTDEEKLACSLSSKINCAKIGTNTCCGDSCTNCEDKNTSTSTFSCSAGNCIVTSCTPGQQYCDDACRTVSEDNEHCGACNNKCGEGTSCDSGNCVCADNKTNCGNDSSPNCRALDSDIEFCGNCGTNCDAIKPANTLATECSTGVCQYKCAEGYFNKGGTTATSINCVRIGTNNCCGTDCTDCDSMASAGTYYACNSSDSTGTCQKSSCGSGQMLCNGTCSTVATDSTNCGSCDHTCGTGAKCSGGSCVCATTGQTNCGTDTDPSCKNLSSDTSNCGGCGVTCAALAPANTKVTTCNAGTCSFECNDGYYNKGTGNTAASINCVKKGTNTCCGDSCTNCEEKNTDSTKYSCSAGTCTVSACSSGELFCSGSCKTVASDKDNCGACDNKCGTGTSCQNGNCQCTTSGQINCGTDLNPVCADTKTNTSYCGNCATRCSDIAPANSSVKSNNGCLNGICQFTCNTGFFNKGTGDTATTINCVPIGTNTCCGSSCKNCDSMASSGTYYTCSNTTTSGTCEKSSCGSGQMLCNGSCSEVATDSLNCGACGNVCGSGAKCENGSCTCSTSGQTNCGSDANPLCISLNSDKANCGGCGIACSSLAPVNTNVKTCSSGACSFECKTGYYNIGTGNTATTINCVKIGTNTCCGSSCTNCESQNTSSTKYTCSESGTCIISSCSDGQLFCSGNCKTVATDSSNCGACGNVCGSGTTCQNGVCVCAGGLTNCGTDAAPACVQVTVDTNYCGNCATKCSNIAPANATVKSSGGCLNGVCQFTCNSGYYNRGTGNTASTINCVPIGTNTCCGSSCTNCDSMASSGTYYTCTSGACVKSSCGSGQTLCNGSCVDTKTNSSNCGGCGNVCGSGTKCENGTCICSTSGQTNCGTASSPSCINVSSTNINNCGGCGVKCSANAPANATASSCSNGICSYTCSSSSYTNCGGTTASTINCIAKANMQTDPNHCGNCTTKCSSSQVCVNGSCQPRCGSSATLCGSTCVDTKSDPNNCGSCGHVCPVPSNAYGATCQAGQCVPTCMPNYYPKDSSTCTNCYSSTTASTTTVSNTYIYCINGDLTINASTTSATYSNLLYVSGKISTVSGSTLQTLSLPKLREAGSINLSSSSLTSLNLSSLENVGSFSLSNSKLSTTLSLPIKTSGGFSLNYNNLLPSITIPNLTKANYIAINNNSALTSVSAPKLLSAHYIDLNYDYMLKTIDLPLLKYLTLDFMLIDSSVTELSLPNLEYIQTEEDSYCEDFGYELGEGEVEGGYLNIDDNRVLTSVNLPKLTYSDLVYIRNNKMLNKVYAPEMDHNVYLYVHDNPNLSCSYINNFCDVNSCIYDVYSNAASSCASCQ